MSDIVEFRKKQVPTGEELKKMYMDSVDPVKLLELKKKAGEMLDELALEIKDNISKKKPPIAAKSSIKSSAGIIAPNNEIADLFKDFTFTLLCEELASERGLKIDFQANAVGIDQKAQQPIIDLMMICTFK